MVRTRSFVAFCDERRRSPRCGAVSVTADVERHTAGWREKCERGMALPALGPAVNPGDRRLRKYHAVSVEIQKTRGASRRLRMRV